MEVLDFHDELALNLCQYLVTPKILLVPSSPPDIPVLQDSSIDLNTAPRANLHDHKKCLAELVSWEQCHPVKYLFSMIN